MSDPADRPPVLDYADDDVGRWVAIAFFPRAFQAHLAACALESRDIESRPGRPAPFPRIGCELMVRADDAARAIELLKQTPAKEHLIRG